MDKHNRPHVCKQPGCEKIQGFTYSGGLRRHEREVHRQHGGPKASCMCPHSDCKRSTGYGFSRKENLSEHLRRVHRSVNDDQEPTRTVAPKTPSPPEFRLIPNTPTATSSPSSSPLEIRKRKRAVEETAEQVGNDGERDWKLQVKRLRKELQQKDNRLKRLEETVAKLAGGQMSGSV